MSSNSSFLDDLGDTGEYRIPMRLTDSSLTDLLEIDRSHFYVIAIGLVSPALAALMVPLLMTLGSRSPWGASIELIGGRYFAHCAPLISIRLHRWLSAPGRRLVRSGHVRSRKPPRATRVLSCATRVCAACLVRLGFDVLRPLFHVKHALVSRSHEMLTAAISKVVAPAHWPHVHCPPAGDKPRSQFHVKRRRLRTTDAENQCIFSRNAANPMLTSKEPVKLDTRVDPPLVAIDKRARRSKTAWHLAGGVAGSTGSARIPQTRRRPSRRVLRMHPQVEIRSPRVLLQLAIRSLPLMFRQDDR